MTPNIAATSGRALPRAATSGRAVIALHRGLATLDPSLIGVFTHPEHPARPARRGKTLIEMLVLMTVMSIILATTAATLIALMKTDRQLRRDLAQQTTLARLGEKFRADAHAASRCELGPACELTLPDGRVVRYEARSGQVVREFRQGQQVQHRDAFYLPETAAITFHQPADLEGRLVQLRIAPIPDSDAPFRAAVRPALIEAAVGLSTLPKPTERNP
jgi:type II secretory pathway pseudopilin PulG